MTTTPTVPCPHCGAMNVPGAAFCESCGKALPSASATGPRVVTAEAMPQSAAGRKLVSDELVKQQKRASMALLIVGILQFTCGAIALVALSQMRGAAAAEIGPMVWIVQFIVAGLFIGLYFWSRRAPLPATIVGLILYVTLVAVNVVTSISALSRSPDQPRTGIGGIGIGWLDIVIIVILAQAIGASLKYKRLLEQQGATV